MGRRMVMVILAAVCVVSCQKYIPEDSSDETAPIEGTTGITDDEGQMQWAVMRTDSGQLWMREVVATGTCEELLGVALSEPWRLPTRAEAQYLKTLSADNHGHRVLCRDEGGELYTFGMPSASVTKAGVQAKYVLRPVRLQTSFGITINPEWEDTIYY